MGIYWAYLWCILCISYAYIKHILETFWAHLKDKSGSSCVQSLPFFPFEIQEIGSNMLSNVSPSLGFAVRLYRINQVSCGILNQHWLVHFSKSTLLINQLITKVSVDQPLAWSGSANYTPFYHNLRGANKRSVTKYITTCVELYAV